MRTQAADTAALSWGEGHAKAVKMEEEYQAALGRMFPEEVEEEERRQEKMRRRERREEEESAEETRGERDADGEKGQGNRDGREDGRDRQEGGRKGRGKLFPKVQAQTDTPGHAYIPTRHPS